MKIKNLINNLDWLRKDIIGRNKIFKTPFGKKPLVYADYTASGRCLYSVENYLMHIMQFYANTHTEDDFTGKTMTRLLHDAEKNIKSSVNAGKHGKIIFTESGTTGGITRLQQILGVFWPPATREKISLFLNKWKEHDPSRSQFSQGLLDFIQKHKPIVFVGPYEHHSNEIMWRQTLCEVVEAPFNEKEEIDLVKLEKMVSDPALHKRLKIGSFSAASNVTGMLSPVYEIAAILHKHNAIACFDFAACAPYVEIDMNRDSISYFDAIYLSPHKFLGGPGSAGILVFNENIYSKHLPPTVAAGGTVDYVSPDGEDFVRDIETREKPGTPGILQAIKTSLAFQVKEKVGLKTISQIEFFYYEKFKKAFHNEEKIIFYGLQDIDKKIPIIPFNIWHNSGLLHPKFITLLLNDLFGIQTRAGCSCAGPYGHRLMHIDEQASNFYRNLISSAGYAGIKPGWVRLNLHYVLSEEELDYIIQALKFALTYAHRFIPQYVFDIKTGDWKHIDADEDKNPAELDIDRVYKTPRFKIKEESNTKYIFKENIRKAYEIAQKLPDEFGKINFEPELKNLVYFPVKNIINYSKPE